ncbi:hypothetical protein MSAS_31370 [Mycobacterium saskatchewanense]|nr:hypothetical protein [Mycobacterium saskatchewanense]BBX63963.1 hypothetical protein MSAS_31370 [Mycobacterium saskatchewanense]
MKKLNVLLESAARFLSARGQSANGHAIGVGTVRETAGARQVFVEVVAVSGETFIGRLAPGDGDRELPALRPGLVVLVAFDPAAREELSLPDDVQAVHAAWLASL